MISTMAITIHKMVVVKTSLLFVDTIITKNFYLMKNFKKANMASN